MDITMMRKLTMVPRHGMYVQMICSSYGFFFFYYYIVLRDYDLIITVLLGRTRRQRHHIVV